MPDIDLIERQRNLIQSFRKATALRSQVETSAEQDQRSKIGNTNSVLNSEREKADGQMNSVVAARNSALDTLYRVGLHDLVNQPAQWAPGPVDATTNPSNELEAASIVARQVAVVIEHNVSSLIQWRHWMTIVKMAFGVFVAMSCIVLAGAGFIGMQPCGWIDRVISDPGKCPSTFSLGNKFVSVAFSSDSKSLAIGCENGCVRLYDIAGQKQSVVLSGRSNVNVSSIGFSRDGKSMASGDLAGEIELWDLAKGQFVRSLNGHSDKVTSLAFSPDGQILVSGSNDQKAILWNLAGSTISNRTINLPWQVNKVAFSPDGHDVAVGGNDNTLNLFDATTGQELGVLRGQPDLTLNLTFSPRGSLLASVSKNKAIWLWDWKQMRAIISFDDLKSDVTSLTFSADGKQLAAGGSNNMILIWETNTWTNTATLGGNTSPALGLAFSSDSKYLTAVGQDMVVRTWTIK